MGSARHTLELPIAVSPETRKVIPGRERKNTLITGSHILNLTRARAELAPPA
ncbi:MAG: hypothetical protein JRH19_22655 [Deltaproteobacteria bacterium]|nr:hypothetical protein [Deltaproteobacteria bacterium]